MEKPGRVFKHLFECTYPVLPEHEEEIFFQHPTEAIKCNQLGVLYYDEERYASYHIDTGSVVREHQTWNKVKARLVGSKPKVIWECYYQEKLGNGIHFVYLNCNYLDLRKENLRIQSKLDAQTKMATTKAKSRFIQNSVEYLMKLESKHEKRGMDKTDLHKALQIPNWLSGARKRYTGPVSKYKVEK
jgi:hypothetical protein